MSFKFPYWRGVLVAAIWIVWPVFWILVVYILELSTSTTRGCSIEGCNPSAGWEAVEFIGALALPIVVTLLWVRWRRLRRGC